LKNRVKLGIESNPSQIVIARSEARKQSRIKVEIAAQNARATTKYVGSGERRYAMKRILGVVILAALFIVGCAVVNVYVTFPEEKIEKAAEDLLAPPSANGPVSMLQGFRFTRTAYAEDGVEVKKDIQTDSPAIRAAKQNMNAWRAALDSFKKDGFIGETNSFSVVVKNPPADSSAARDVKKIVSDENRERKAMMDELLKINSVAPGEEVKFKRIFADVMKKYSPKGTWIQSDTGEWSRK